MSVGPRGGAIPFSLKDHNTSKISTYKIAFETSAIIKTHLNVHRSPKFNVSEQVLCVGIEVFLIPCKLGPFWVFQCVCERGTMLTFAPVLIRNFSPEARSVT